MFLGLTDTDRAAAQTIVDQIGFPWPLAHDAREVIGSLIDGPSCIPALFVIGADGLISWNDGMARYRHSVAFLDGELEEALEQALREIERRPQ